MNMAMLDRVLFLDFDGVLNHATTPGTHALDPACVAQLGRVLDSTDASICFSTSWRWAHSVTSLAGFLQEAGVDTRDRVVGTTPTGVAPRGAEILAWLSVNPTRQFAIVDDTEEAVWIDRLGTPSDLLHSRFVQTSWGTGLTKADADQLIELLRKPTDESLPEAFEEGSERRRVSRREIEKALRDALPRRPGGGGYIPRGSR